MGKGLRLQPVQQACFNNAIDLLRRQIFKSTIVRRRMGLICHKKHVKFVKFVSKCAKIIKQCLFILFRFQK